MSLEIKKFYEDIEKVKYKDYVIDNDLNLNLLYLLKHICILSQKYNLDFKLTGAWAFVFQTGKIYRTISDIDLIILRKDFKDWVRALNNNYGLLYEDEPTAFVRKILQNNPPIFSFRDKKDKNKIMDIIVTNQFSYSKYEEVSFDKFNIKYRLPYKFLKPKNGFEYGRDIDSDDVEFYSKFIN
jgi:hypothetical protein